MNYFTTTELTDSSKKAYNNRLAKWLEIGGNWTMNFLVSHLKEAMGVLVATDKIKHSHRNHHNFISAVVAYLNYEGNEPKLLKAWKKLQIENTEPVRQHYLTGKPTDLQKDKVMNWSKILSVRDRLPVGKIKLLLGFYTYLNPVRADYFQLAMYDSERSVPDGNSNYVLTEKSGFRDSIRKYKIVLRDYKTVKKYGTLTLDMPPPLVELFDSLDPAHPTRSIVGNNFVFENEKGDPYTRASFSQWANRALTKVFKTAYDQPMTLTALRHIFTSQLDSNQPIAELHKVGQSMGHNVAQQRLYKWDESTAQEKNEVVLPDE
jgi:hypothetical protein